MYAKHLERRHCKNCNGGRLNKYPLDGLVGGCRDRMDNPERKYAFLRNDAKFSSFKLNTELESRQCLTVR